MNKYDYEISIFPVIIEPLEEGGYFATCPILKGCHAEGKTYGEALDIIQDVIKNHLELRQKHGEPVSALHVKKPSDINLEIALPVHR